MELTHRLVRVEQSDKSGLIRNGEMIEGFYKHDPTVGARFTFWGVPLTEGKQIRLISTSPVTGLLDNNGFLTQSGSRYKLVPIT